MSKIVCDVCGTSYPDTADQCPICGCAKPEEAGEVKSYTYVRGGRFSAKNVNKRLKEKQLIYAQSMDEEEVEEEPVRSNRGLLIAVVLLLLAIIAVAAYLYINYFMDPLKPDGGNLPASTTGTPLSPEGTGDASQTEPAGTVPGESTGVACEQIELDVAEVTLSNPGDGYLINWTLSPADTTDTVSFSSSDPDVAAVDENGKITAVAPGSAVITVTCGNVTNTITVVCNIETEPVTEPTTAPTEPPAEEFKLNRKDITMTVGDPAWPLYRGDIPKTSIEWWSSDDSVATVKNGNVTPVGAGVATIYAKYNGQTYECIVRVKAA